MKSTRTDLEGVAGPARAIAERVVWCTVTTVSAAGEPRSRLMHPVWTWDGAAPVALVTARPTPLKRRHLAAHPAVSCSYWDPAHDTLVVDATARWLDRAERTDAWAAVRAVPPPVGFDPAMIWPDGPGAADCGFLRLVAHRVVVTRAGGPSLLWSGPREG